MRIAVIADGSNSLGMGHVSQAITLSERLQEKCGNQAELTFLTRSDEKVEAIFRATRKRVLRCENDAAVYAALLNMRPDRVIIDHLNVDPELARKISQDLRTKLIILTNLSEANRYADVTVMAGMGSGLKNIRKCGDAGQVQLWGPKYWLIRPEFFLYEKKPILDIHNLMLIFGGSDPANLTAKVLSKLSKIQKGFHIVAVLGASYGGRADLEHVLCEATGSPSHVTLFQNSNSIAELMHGSDLVFTSPGLSFFEALAVGTPVICFHQNKFQQEAWANVIVTHAAYEVPLVDHLIASRSFIYPNDTQIEEMKIGQGVDELLEEILS